MYIYIYKYIRMYLYIYTYIYVYIQVNTGMYICSSIYKYTYMCVYIYICIYIYIYPHLAETTAQGGRPGIVEMHQLAQFLDVVRVGQQQGGSARFNHLLCLLCFHTTHTTYPRRTKQPTASCARELLMEAKVVVCDHYINVCIYTCIYGQNINVCIYTYISGQNVYIYKYQICIYKYIYSYICM